MAIEASTDGLTLTECTFEQNEADDRGGGLYVYDASPVITECRFEQNTAPEGGGAFAHLAGDKTEAIGPHFNDTIFFDHNLATGPGGGGAKTQTNVTPGDEGLDDTQFSGCTFSINATPALFFNSAPNPRIASVIRKVSFPFA